MKKIRAFCPSYSEGNFINQAGYELIRNKKNDLLDTPNIFIGPQTMAAQTAIYMMEILEKEICRIVIVEELRNIKIEKKLENNKKSSFFYEENKNNFYQTIREHFKEEEIIEIEKDCGNKMKACFNNMKEEEEFMLIGHNSFISMAANHFTGSFHRARKFDRLKEMESVDFFMDDNGDIFVSANFFTL